MQPPLGSPSEFGARRPRRRTLRWVFLGVGLTIFVLGVVLLIVGFAPGLLGLPYGVLGWRYAGGLIGLFFALWGGLILLRLSLRWGGGRRFGPDGPGGHRFDPAIMAARQRYARGEISREQFQQIVADLRQRPGPPPP